MGYAGGSTSAPTYHSIGDHSETIEIDFLPEVVSYADLLAVFLRSHNPCRAAFRPQYRSAVFYRSGAQRSVADASLQQAARERDQAIETAVEEHQGFTLAEDYHQKYLLCREAPVLAEFLAIYPESDRFLHSTAVTRANAFCGGHGAELVDSDLPRMGLSESSQARLRAAL